MEPILRNRCVLTFTICLTAGFTSCMADGPALDGPNDDAITPGKADGSSFSDCELSEVLVYVNDTNTDVATLTTAGVNRRTANNIVGYRNGDDHNAGTNDDDLFDDIAELDSIPYVGPVAMQTLVKQVKSKCQGSSTPSIDVIFSPQEYPHSHLARTRDLIDHAQRSVDIGMYDANDGDIRDALQRATERGVSVRMVFDQANKEHASPAGTESARFEAAGVDVRYVNKIMHHKFVIIDGPRDDAGQAADTTLITGSANWSNSAATRFDENTVFMHGNAELALRFQREFNYLWQFSRDLVSGDGAFEQLMSIDITDEDIAAVDSDSSDAVFTSANFKTSVSTTNGNTFSTVAGRNTVADQLVDLIANAERSIDIASGHLRSRPVFEALIAKHEADPDVAIRVYLDDQEYLSESAAAQQETDHEACLADATTESARQQCNDTGFLFSYDAHQAGIEVRYKFYAYRWDFSYAPQMHHKYMIFDGRIVASGSYNLSDNAEHETFENMVIYDGATYPALVHAFEQNFNAIWTTGADNHAYQSLLDDVNEGTDSFPIVFDPIALDWDQATALKQAMRANCPDVDSADFRTNAAMHRFCDP